jgi:uncharacterized protein (TIGR03435 family)
MKTIACIAVAAFQLAAADVTGGWTGSTGGSPIYLILKQDGSKLSGSAGPVAAEQMAVFENGKVDGDHLTFRVGPFHLDLRLEGERLVGETIEENGPGRKVLLKRASSLKRPAGVPAPAFEVASVKPAPPRVPGANFSSSMNVSPGRLTCTNVTLKKLIARAYSLKDYQVVGPEWINEDLYAIVASMPVDTTGDDLLEMVQGLITERFQMVTHREMKDMPVYELVVGKNGSKLKPVEYGRGSTSLSPGKLVAQAVPLRNLTEQLSRLLNRPVLDKTGMAGAFDFALEFAPEGRGADEAGDLPVSPSLFTAVQEQLGLKLESRKAPVEILVVDKAERVPVGN